MSENSDAVTRQERWISRTRRPLDALAVVFLVDFILIWSFPGAGTIATTLFDAVAWAVWAAFAVDYLARLLLDTRKRQFVMTHKLDLLMVVLPMLRMLRIFLLLRRSLSNVSTEKIAGSIVSIVIATVFASAFFVWRVEYDAPGATITTFRAALWWAVVTTTTVGYGDYSPVTAVGRGIAVVVMVVGIGLIGTISATIAAWFVERPASGSGTGPTTPETPRTSPEEGGLDEASGATSAVILARLDSLAVAQVALATEQQAIRRLLEARQPTSGLG